MPLPANLARMFAALSATNSAILYAKSPNELYQQACDAALSVGDFLTTAIFLAESGTTNLRLIAGAGQHLERLRKVSISVAAKQSGALGLCAKAFRSQKPSVSDSRNNEHSRERRKDIEDADNEAAAAFPLLRNGQSAGVLLAYVRDAEELDKEIVSLLSQMAENVSFALNNFDRAEQKTKIEKQKESLTRMFAALNATNEAIMRAKTRADLFDMACEAAVVGGNFTSTAIMMLSADGAVLENVASAGPDRERARKVRLPIDVALSGPGLSLTGTAFRTKLSCVSNDYLVDFGSSGHFINAVSAGGTRSGAGFPLVVDGKAVGVLVFLSKEIGAFTPELTALLKRLADNISFALENFDRGEEKTKADARIEYLASHDSMTDLPNREMFNQLLHFTIEASQRHQRRFAVLFIDLDKFKVINDSLGHEAGDILLIETANRLRQNLRSNDVVARLGGDEFVVIVDDLTESRDAAVIARTLLSKLSEPLQLCGHECHTTASIGIAMFPADGSDVQTLTKHADMAMYIAKEDGKNDFRFFTNKITTPSIERLMLEASLRLALERNEFVLHYQPKTEVATSQITGVEALLRWSHPNLGMLQPQQFIPLAEETGLIIPIGRWVLSEACAQNMAWQREGLRRLSMAVNISLRQFQDPGLLKDIDLTLAASGMSPTLLQLELTESMVRVNAPQAIKVLDEIHRRGIHLAIDDFGAGYSSMSLIKQFQIDTIKIDPSLVRDLPKNSEDRAIAQAIINIGKALGKTVIAEGVETSEQETFLRDHACDEMQGFLFSKPVPAERISDLLRPSLSVSASIQASSTDVGRRANQTKFELARSA